MALLIDGYNLLYAAGIVASGIGPGTLERARNALINFVATSIDPQELPHTVVVFDAKDPPPGRPRSTTHRGLTVRFAAGYEDADTLIEELIQADFSPRQLVVVSSDHRIQRAARRRRATPIDSDKWYARLVEQLRQRRAASEPIDVRPKLPLSEAEVERWLAEFGDLPLMEWEKELQEEEQRGEQSQRAPSAAQPADDAAPPAAPSEKDRIDVGEIESPFPPGYGDDVLRETLEELNEDVDLSNPFPPGYGEDLLEEK